jgi:hypothetical protein
MGEHQLARGAALMLAMLGGLVCAPHSLRAAASLVYHAEVRALDVLYDTRSVLTYTFATNQFKPYVRELITFDGVDLLRDSPVDHVHHHGLMYGIKVNDLNFWEESSTAGHQVPQADLVRGVRKNDAGQPVAHFSQVLHWVGADHATASNTAPFALLVEKRTLGLAVDPARERILLTWESEFDVGEGAPQVTLSGTPYHGLGIRFRADFDGTADRRNADDLAYPPDGVQGTLATSWMAVSHVTAGRPYTVVLFLHPSNPGRPRFFSMQKPFTYLSATQGLDEAPLVYRRGDRWKLKYLVLATPGRPTKSDLDRQYQAFARQ